MEKLGNLQRKQGLRLSAITGKQRPEQIRVGEKCGNGKGSGERASEGVVQIEAPVYLFNDPDKLGSCVSIMLMSTRLNRGVSIASEWCRSKPAKRSGLLSVRNSLRGSVDQMLSKVANNGCEG